MSEQDPIPPRRRARHQRPGEDDDVPPPWANLPPVRPGRPGAPARPGGPPPRFPDGPRHSGGSVRPDGRPLYDDPRFPDQPPRPEVQRPEPSRRPTGPMRHGNPTPPGGYPAGPGRPGNSRPAGQSRPRAGWLPEPEEDTNYPGWAAAATADPADNEPRLGRAGQRAAMLLLRRRRRSYLMAGGVVVVIAAVLATVFLTRGGGQAAALPTDLVTQFQPGELQQVPVACDTVTQGSVHQFLPGKVKVATPQEPYGKLGSQCFWTVDSPPVYRLLDLSLLAYKPSGLASGDGSATNNAIDQYRQQLKGMQHPGKKSITPKGTPVKVLKGVGNEAFSALQEFKTSNGTTYVATVEIRFHNVIVSAEMNGLDGVTKKGSYGPITTSQLQAAALAFAESALAALR